MNLFVRIGKNQYALDWVIDRYKRILDIKSAKGKREFSDILLPLIRQLDDAVEKDHYLNVLAEEIGVDKSALDEKMSVGAEPEQPKKQVKHTEVLVRASIERQRVQDQFLALLMTRPTLRELMSEQFSSDMFPTKDGKELFERLRKDPELDQKDLTKVKNLADYVKIESLLYEELYQGIELNELHEEAERLKADLVTRFVKIEKEKLSLEQRKATDEVEIRLLQEKDRFYNSLLNEVKGAAHG
jgi:DNA primase